MHVFDNIFESILYMVFYDLTHGTLYSDFIYSPVLCCNQHTELFCYPQLQYAFPFFPTSCVSYPTLISTRWMVINELEEKILFILQSLSKLNLSWEENSLNSSSSVTYQFSFLCCGNIIYIIYLHIIYDFHLLLYFFFW